MRACDSLSSLARRTDVHRFPALHFLRLLPCSTPSPWLSAGGCTDAGRGLDPNEDYAKFCCLVSQGCVMRGWFEDWYVACGRLVANVAQLNDPL